MYDDYEPIICENFIIKELPAGTTSSSTITTSKSSYDYSETISATFSVPVAIPNSWIGVYMAEDADNTMAAIPEPLGWLYAACNNVAGDQSETKNCAATATSGTVDIDGRFGPSPRYWKGSWPFGGGTYRVCLSFYNNWPYAEFVCSEDTFSIMPSATISVPSEVEFGSEIVVSFTNLAAASTNWIGIYDVDDDPAVSSDTLFWSSMCGSQEDWVEPECPAQSAGSVTFAATDPNLAYDEQWPPSPGARKVCLMYDDYEPIICENFIIKELPAGTTSSSTITTSKSSYDYSETISATFSVPVAIPNSWIGVYMAEDADNTMAAIPEPLGWLYAACNNVAGDQSETKNCAATATSGTVDIDGRFGPSPRYWKGSWPFGGGTYRVCLSFYWNTPNTKFVCSDNTFSIAPMAP